MADAAERAVTAYFDSAAQAEQAAQDLMRWDQADDELKLGAIGILTRDAQGKLQTKNLSSRNTGKGAKVGMGLGALAAVLSGGLTLLPTAVAGAAGGGLVGALSKKGLGLSDDDLQELSAQLGGGRAALLVLCDDPQVEATAAQLVASGGTVRRPAAAVSAEALQEAVQAAGAAPEAPAAPAPPPTDAPGAGGAGRVPRPGPLAIAAVAVALALAGFAFWRLTRGPARRKSTVGDEVALAREWWHLGTPGGGRGPVA
jgi:uncharacterized membrane protein